MSDVYRDGLPPIARNPAKVIELDYLMGRRNPKYPNAVFDIVNL